MVKAPVDLSPGFKTISLRPGFKTLSLGVSKAFVCYQQLFHVQVLPDSWDWNNNEIIPNNGNGKKPWHWQQQLRWVGDWYIYLKYIFKCFQNYFFCIQTSLYWLEKKTSVWSEGTMSKTTVENWKLIHFEVKWYLNIPHSS